MILGRTKQSDDNWKQQMHRYQYTKRTKKPFGKQFKPEPERVTESIIKKKQRQFDPVLQKYEKQDKQKLHQQKEEKKRNLSLLNHLKNASKHQRDYDFINLHSFSTDVNKTEITSSPEKKDKQPLRNVYNPINNKPLPQIYYHGRRVQLPKQHRFKYLGPKTKDFDIVKCRYRQDNDQKEERQKMEQDSMIYNKYDKTHQGYNPVFAKFYNDKKQEEYQQNLAKSQLQYGSDYNKRFPASYLNRQPLLFDHTKHTESLAAIDQRQLNAKKRFKLKYIIEEDYKRRNEEDYEKKQAQIRNRVHNSHILQNKAKQFDIVNLDNYQSNRAENLYQKKAIQSTWDRLNYGNPHNQMRYSESSRSRQATPMSIKSSGFA